MDHWVFHNSNLAQFQTNFIEIVLNFVSIFISAADYLFYSRPMKQTILSSVNLPFGLNDCSNRFQTCLNYYLLVR